MTQEGRHSYTPGWNTEHFEHLQEMLGKVSPNPVFNLDIHVPMWRDYMCIGFTEREPGSDIHNIHARFRALIHTVPGDYAITCQVGDFRRMGMRRDLGLVRKPLLDQGFEEVYPYRVPGYQLQATRLGGCVLSALDDNWGHPSVVDEVSRRHDRVDSFLVGVYSMVRHHTRTTR